MKRRGTRPSKIILFSEAFALGRTQAEIDFVDVPLNTDIWLCIDPFAISQREDVWSRNAHSLLVVFFQAVVDAIRGDDSRRALELLSHLSEPNETRFGLSRGLPKGAGVGPSQAKALLGALTQSTAVKVGLISAIEECELMIEGVSSDKISDLTTNIIRRSLMDYTACQCELLQIPVRSVAMPPWFDGTSMRWHSTYAEVPVWNGNPVLLVPKAIVRTKAAYDQTKYYRDFVLEYLRAEHLAAQTSLVRSLKNGSQRVYIKDLQRESPISKEFLFDFTLKHPELLADYRRALALQEQTLNPPQLGDIDEMVVAEVLGAKLKAIGPGASTAGEYHSLMIGILEFLFYPELICPRKEVPINQGRKRIDIVMTNGARQGPFEVLSRLRHFPCTYIMFECKNYAGEVGNPELDQLVGRFSGIRGQMGFLCCRRLNDRPLFLERCRDSFRHTNGLIVPLDDDDILRFLSYIESGERSRIQGEVQEAIDQTWLA